MGWKGCLLLAGLQSAVWGAAAGEKCQHKCSIAHGLEGACGACPYSLYADIKGEDDSTKQVRMRQMLCAGGFATAILEPPRHRNGVGEARLQGHPGRSPLHGTTWNDRTNARQIFAARAPTDHCATQPGA